MTVPVQTPVANHVGNGVTTAFAFGFKLLDEDDITVIVDGVTKTLNIDYTIAGVGVEAGGTATFAVAPASLADVALVRQVALNRLTDYQYSGDFESPTVNRDFDRLVMMLQDSGLALANTIRLPPGDTSSGLLPLPAERALLGLGFDASGNLALFPTTAGDATALALSLASSVLPTQGPGLVAYNPALSYAAGTIGAALEGAEATFKGRASGAGDGGMVDLSASQARTILNGTAWNLAAGTADLQKLVSGGSAPAPALNLTVTDTLAVGSAFYLGAAFLLNRDGGTGHREAATARITSNNAPASEFAVGMHGYARIQTGSGNAFGLNGYAWVDAAALATAEAVGAELNTDIRRAVVRKVGVQIIDAATSTASGTTYDAGILIGSQAGGAGYSVGIRFGLDGTTGFGMLNDGTLIAAQTSTNALRAGLDFSGLSNFSLAPIVLRPNTKGIWWGTAKEGGSVISETATAGPVLSFLNEETQIRTSTGSLNFSVTGEDTFSRFRTGADGASIVRRVIAGAADSGGAGYRTLRVEN